MTGHLPRHRLEELAAGRADPSLQAHLDACTTCAARLEALQAARSAFLQRRSPEAFARATVARQTRPTRSRALPLLLVAAAALALIWVRSDTPEIRYKGTRSLQVIVRHGEHQEVLADGAALAAGDQLAFVYSLREPRHLLLLSIDDTGAVSKFANLHLQPSQRAQVPVGVQLDAHRGQERLVAFFSAQPLDEEEATRELKLSLTNARDAGIAGMARVQLSAEQASVWFQKP